MQITNKMGASADKLSWRVECRRILLFISAIFQVGAWDPGRCYIVLHYGTFSGSNRFSYWQLRGFRVNRFRISPPEMPHSPIQNNLHPVSLTTLKMASWSYGHIFKLYKDVSVLYMPLQLARKNCELVLSQEILFLTLVIASYYLHDKIHIRNVKIDITFSWAQFWVATREGTFSGDKWGIEN